jgi:hypothetical protein
MRERRKKFRGFFVELRRLGTEFAQGRFSSQYKFCLETQTPPFLGGVWMVSRAGIEPA